MTTSLRGTLELTTRAYDHPDAQELVHGLFDEQVERYGYADPAESDAGAYVPPDGLFVVGYLGGNPATCGGYRRHDLQPGTVEIKKMYTLPPWRGQGIGHFVLTELERHAARAGAERAILETGVRNVAALSLYSGMGYEPTARYAADRDPTINRAFVKDLLPSARE